MGLSEGEKTLLHPTDQRDLTTGPWRPEPLDPLFYSRACSQDKIPTVAKPGLGGCLLLPVAPPTLSAFPPSILSLLLSLASWKLPVHPLSGHTPRLLRFPGLRKELAAQRSREPEPQRPACPRSSPTGDGAGSRLPEKHRQRLKPKCQVCSLCSPRGGQEDK